VIKLGDKEIKKLTANLTRSDDLPTPELPMSKTLNK